MLRFVTAGESHGQALIAWISGLPAGVPIDFEFIQVELHRRQLGYGRGGRQKIEKDRVEAISGIRHGQTIGAPIALRLENKDWANWEKALPVENIPGAEEARRPLTAPRPGHADLAGAMKFNFHDARYILERAAARSEIQAVCANLDSPLRCVDSATETLMKGEVDIVHRAGNTVGGIFEVVAHNVITGLGSHAQWDEKLDGRLAQAVMSIQAVKGVEIGAGIAAAVSYGSEVMDEIGYDAANKRFTRATNRAGGLEGGITNGEDVVVRGYLKPISTLRSPLATADMVTKQPITAAYERSDVCVVPAGGVAGEAMVSFVLAQALIEKFGGDSLAETRRNFEGYQKQLIEF